MTASVLDDTEATYEFVGGPYDGQHLPVAPPPEFGAELVVHALGRFVPAEFYVLGHDGRFHYEEPVAVSA